MKRRAIFISGAILIVALLFLLMLANRHTKAVGTFGFGATVTHKRGHLGDTYSDHLSIAAVTNQTASTITLNDQLVQWKKPDGGVVTDMASQWNGKDSEVSLPPNGVALLPFDFPRDAEAFRITFTYKYSEDGGSLHGQYESSWMPNKSPEPAAVGAVSSAFAVHVVSRRWLSFLR
jgi:hypothetical protein